MCDVFSQAKEDAVDYIGYEFPENVIMQTVYIKELPVNNLRSKSRRDKTLDI